MKSKSFPLLIAAALLLIASTALNRSGMIVSDLVQGLMIGISAVTACLGLYIFSKERSKAK